MIKLFTRLVRRRPSAPRRTPVNLEFDRRDWADLPVHHPRADIDG